MDPELKKKLIDAAWKIPFWIVLPLLAFGLVLHIIETVKELAHAFD